ncbi:MAG: hypothetical protein WC028_16800 [Candidatus Obscuribacterales bacterium]
MAGDESVRNCAQCACKVQDISDYTPEQLEQLLKEVDAGEEICVAFRAPVGASASKSSALATKSSADFYRSTPLSLESAAKIQALNTTFPIKKFSVAVAASVSLSCLPPGESLSALAKNAEDRSCQAELLSKPSEINKTLAPKNSKTDIVKIAPEDHGFWLGRPAPSAIRNLVNKIEPWTGKLDTAQVKPQMDIFQRDLNNGQISQQAVEDLAAAYSKHGPTGKARMCYTLLIKLAERHPVPPEQIKLWQEKVRLLGVREFSEELSQSEKESKQKHWSAAIKHLSNADNVRSLDAALAQQFRWSLIANRMDKLQPRIPYEQQFYFLSTAVTMANTEEITPEQRQWLKGKRNSALTTLAQVVAVADREISRGRYRSALDEMHRALQIGTIDPVVSDQCDWSSAVKRLEIIERLVEPTCKPDCKDLMARMKGMSK